MIELPELKVYGSSINLLWPFWVEWKCPKCSDSNTSYLGAKLCRICRSEVLVKLERAVPQFRNGPSVVGARYEAYCPGNWVFGWKCPVCSHYNSLPNEGHEFCRLCGFEVCVNSERKRTNWQLEGF